jgi:phospholipid transport system transporter-binding protein
MPAEIKMAQATSVAGAAVQAVRAGARSINCAGLVQFDSSALSVLLAAKRAVAAAGGSESLRIEDSPAKLHQLAQLYGVDSLLFSAAT